jgi:hypothetical protein
MIMPQLLCKVVSALYTLDLEVLPSVHGLEGTDNWAFPYTALTIVLKLKRNFALAMRRFSLGSFCNYPSTKGTSSTFQYE